MLLPLVDLAGKPMSDNGSQGAVLPHAFTFASVWNSISRVYSYRWDEALKHLPENALAMRRDCYIRSLLQERAMPTVNRKWQIVGDSKTDPTQVATAKALTAITKLTPHLKRQLKYLCEATWYGRYGSQIVWRQRRVLGQDRWCVVRHKPVNGDKIQYQWDGTPCVAISTQIAGQFPPDAIINTDRMPVLRLIRDSWRQQFIIHRHEVDDADYFDGEMAGAVEGVGLRTVIYWAWWLRDEMLSWAVDFMRRVGTMGLLIFPYEAGNDASKQKAEENAQAVCEKTAMTMPVHLDGRGGNALAPIHITSNTQGIDALQRMIADYFEAHIERMIVGQSMSSGTDSSGSLGGTGRAEFAENTKFQLLHYDADNLAETLTSDLIAPMMKLNFPQFDFPMRLEFQVEDPDQKEKAESVKSLAPLGVTFDLDEVRELTGMSKPADGAETIGGKEAPPAPGGPSPAGNPPPAVPAPEPNPLPFRFGMHPDMYFDDEQYDLLSYADRSHLVKKVITDKNGHQRTVWVNPAKDGGGGTPPPKPPVKPVVKPKPVGGKGKPDKAASQAAVTDAMGKLAKGEALTAEELQALPGHLQNLTVPEIQAHKKQFKVLGGKVKAEHIKALVSFAGFVSKNAPEPPKPPEPEPKPEPPAKEKELPKPIDLMHRDPNHPVAKAIASDHVSHEIVKLLAVHHVDGLRDRIALKHKEKEEKRNAYVEMTTSLPLGHPERKKALDEYSALIKEEAALREIEEKQEKQAKERLQGALRPTMPTEIYSTLTPIADGRQIHPHAEEFDAEKMEPSTKKAIVDGFRFVESILSGGKPLDLSVTHARDGRAFYDDHRKMIAIANIESAHIVAHEIGHAIEKTKPGVLEAAQKFLAYRVAEEKLIDMGTLPGNEALAGELGRKDNFDRAFDAAAAHYIGKRYVFGDTEILSMGVEKLYKDPARCAARDHEYCHFSNGIPRSEKVDPAAFDQQPAPSGSQPETKRRSIWKRLTGRD